MGTENKRKIIMIVSLVFVALVLAGNIYTLIDTISNAPTNIKCGRIVDICFGIIALISAIIYISSGFKKASAKYFKFFLYAFILSLLITLFVLVIFIDMSPIAIISLFISFVLLNVLFGTKDLGKKTSLTLSIIIFACFLFVMILSLCTVQNYNIILLFANLAGLSLSAVLIVMMLLKYYDKSLRNTK